MSTNAIASNAKATQAAARNRAFEISSTNGRLMTAACAACNLSMYDADEAWAQLSKWMGEHGMGYTMRDVDIACLAMGSAPRFGTGATILDPLSTE